MRSNELQVEEKKFWKKELIKIEAFKNEKRLNK